jgi:Zn-dependent peptidase ImmA (M78 family)
LAVADHPAPPVLDAVLAALPEVVVRRWQGLPQPVLLLPDGRSWLILVDPDVDQAEQNFHVLHQVKHILDAPDRTPGSCEGKAAQAHCHRFAVNVLAPTIRLRHDLACGLRDAEVLAHRYGVPTAAMRRRLRELGITEGGAR